MSALAHRPPVVALLLVTVGWLLFGVLAGIGAYVADWNSGVSLQAFTADTMQASILWIPLTYGVFLLARRYPLWPLSPRHVTLHLGFGLLATWVLNALFFAASWALGRSELALVQIGEPLLRSSFRHLQTNAAAYWSIAALTTLWVVRRPGAATTRESVGGQADRPESSRRTLRVRLGNRIHFVVIDEIDWIEGAGDYARIHVGNRRYLSAERLKLLEGRLEPLGFERIHRSRIVNLSRVTDIRHRTHGDYEVTLRDGTTLGGSRTRRSALAALLESVASSRVD